MKYLFALIFCASFSLSRAQKHEVPPTSEFSIRGAVKHERTFRIEDLKNFKHDSLGSIILRNKHGEEKAVVKELGGVLLKTLLDSAGITADKPKEYSELVILLIASDGYKNVYSWNELYNTEAGNQVYVITKMDGKTIAQMPDRILVMSLSDLNSGRRHLKGLAKIEVRKI